MATMVITHIHELPLSSTLEYVLLEGFFAKNANLYFLVLCPLAVLDTMNTIITCPGVALLPMALE